MTGREGGMVHGKEREERERGRELYHAHVGMKRCELLVGEFLGANLPT